MTLKTAISGVALGAAVVLTGVGPAAADDWVLVGYYDTLRSCQIDGAWYVHHTAGARGYDCRPGGPRNYGLVLIF